MSHKLNNTYRPWIALFSQTGGEICDLAEHFGRWPDLIVTNNGNFYRLDNRVRDLSYIPNGPFELQWCRLNINEYDYLNFFNWWRSKTHFQSPLITLHGWLKIIPAEICDKYEIYNGHPGLIHPDFSPELKGKNPQERVWQNNDHYKIIGSVVHRVTPIVDDGKIITYNAVSNNCKTEQEVYDTLRKTSKQAWIDFLGTHL